MEESAQLLQNIRLDIYDGTGILMSFIIIGVMVILRLYRNHQ